MCLQFAGFSWSRLDIFGSYFSHPPSESVFLMVLAEVKDGKPNHANALKCLLALCLLIPHGTKRVTWLRPDLRYEVYSPPVVQ